MRLPAGETLTEPPSSQPPGGAGGALGPSTRCGGLPGPVFLTLYLCKALCQSSLGVGGGQGGAGAGSPLSPSVGPLPLDGGEGDLWGPRFWSGKCIRRVVLFYNYVEETVDSHSETGHLQALGMPSTPCPSFARPFPAPHEVPSRPPTSRPKPYVPCPGTARPALGPTGGPAEGDTAA